MSVDVNAIAENLAELLSNSTNIASNMYDLFVTTEEMDVTLQQYDENNLLQDITIPNLAKARKVAKSGHGSPEGVVVGNVGNCYVDMDYSYVYFKVNGNNTNTGWMIILTQSYLDSALANYVPTSRTVNGKALITNISLEASDVGALSSSTQYGYKLNFNSTTGQIELYDQNNTLLSGVVVGSSGANKDLSNLTDAGYKRVAPIVSSSTSEKFLTNNGTVTRWDVAHVDNVESSKFSTTLEVVPTPSSLIVQNDYNGTKDSLGVITETLTYQGDGWSSGTGVPTGQNGYTQVVYDDVHNKFVAASSDSADYPIYSSDGINWNSSSSTDVCGSQVKLAYGNGICVTTINGSGTIHYSVDGGVTWTAGATTIDTNNKGITYGNGKFIITINGANICYTSTDGSTWTSSTIEASTTHNWGTIAYGDNRFVMLEIKSGAINPCLAYSETGATNTWTVVQPFSTQNGQYDNLFYVNDRFVKLGSSSGGDISYSSDGVSWTTIDTGAASGVTWYGIAYGDGKYVLVPQGSQYTAYSTDFINWTINENFPYTGYLPDVAYNNGIFVALTSNYLSNPTAYFYSKFWTDSNNNRTDISNYQLSITSGTLEVNNTLDLTYTTVNNANDTLKFWTGSATQYNNIASKDSNTQYNVVEKGVYLGSTEVTGGKLNINVDNPTTLGKANIIGFLVPDYSNMVECGSVAGATVTYTCPSKGWIVPDFITYSGAGYLSINGVDVHRRTNTSAYMVTCTGSYLVDEGDVVTAYSSYATVGYTRQKIYFIPCKGV